MTSIPPPAQTLNPFKDTPPVGDFYAPFFTVEFTNYAPSATVVDANGVEVPAQGSVASSGGETRYEFTDNPEVGRLRSFATSLEIVNKGGAANTATLVLEPPYEEAVRICESRSIQKQAIMSCQWGYLPGAPGMPAIQSRLHHFTLASPPRLEISGVDVTITIIGQDTYSYAARRREDRTAYARNSGAFSRKLVSGFVSVVFGGTREGSEDHMQPGVFKTDLSILEHLAGKVGMTIDTSLVPKPHVGAQQVAIGAFGSVSVPQYFPGSTLLQERPLNTDEPDVLEQNELDWSFFIALCRQNNCDFFTEGTVIYIVDKNLIKVQEAAYRLVLMQQPKDNHDIPMQAFSTNAIPNMFMPEAAAAATEVRRVSADPDSGAVVDFALDPAKMDDQEFLGALTAAGRAVADGRTVKLSDRSTLIPNPAFTATETGRHVSVPHAQSNRDEAAAQVVRNGAMVSNTDAQATIPGVVSIIPQMIVQVSAGFPTTFDGPYLVKQATHRLGGSGYDTELELIRDTTSASSEGSGTRPATGGNNPPVRESGFEEVVSVDLNADGEGA